MSNAPHERRGHSGLSLVVYGSRGRSMRLLGCPGAYDLWSFLKWWSLSEWQRLIFGKIPIEDAAVGSADTKVPN